MGFCLVSAGRPEWHAIADFDKEKKAAPALPPRLGPAGRPSREVAEVTPDSPRLVLLSRRAGIMLRSALWI